MWDGECGLCGRVVEWIERHDNARLLTCTPYQHASSPPMTARLRRACARSLHVITHDGRRLRAGRATLRILDRLGWRRLAQLLGLPPFIWGVEVGYRLVASKRPLISRLLFRGRP